MIIAGVNRVKEGRPPNAGPGFSIRMGK